MTAKSETLALTREGTVQFVTLNRPDKRNAINAKMWAELEETFDSLRDDRTVKTIVLRGAGGTFCAGGDISERSASADSADPAAAVAARNRLGGRVFAKIDRAPQAVVAVVEGHALGGGFGLACAADVTLASPDARLGLPEVGLGIAPAQIAPFLIRRIGVAQFRRLAVTAARLGAEEAHLLGIVHEVHEKGAALDDAVGRTLDALDRGAPAAIAAAKELARLATELPEEDYLDQSARRLGALATAPEGQEGAAAFREKRLPVWRTRVAQ